MAGVFKVSGRKNIKNGQINLAVSKKSNPELWKRLDEQIKRGLKVKLKF